MNFVENTYDQKSTVSEEAQHRTTIMKTKSHSYSTEVKKPHTNYINQEVETFYKHLRFYQMQILQHQPSTKHDISKEIKVTP